MKLKRTTLTLLYIFTPSLYFFLSTQPSLAQTTVNFGDIKGPSAFQQISAEPGKEAEKYVSIIIGALTAIGGIAFIFYFLIGALNWITSAGDKQKMDQAKNAMTHAAIGIIAIVLAYFITSIIGTILGFDILSPADLLQ